MAPPQVQAGEEVIPLSQFDGYEHNDDDDDPEEEVIEDEAD